jgi:hypothetical protein
MKKHIIYIFTILLIAGGTGCSKNYLNINSNPNSATSTTPELVLPQALTTTAAEQSAVGDINPFLQCWMGYWAISGSYAASTTDPASYYQTTTFGDATWQNMYHNLEDYNFIEQTGKAENKPFYQGVAKIMKALVFQRLVDMFNNVPYIQAFNGPTLIDPKYDSAESVYTAFTTQLDSGVILMENPLAVIDANNSDVMFKGNNASWIQFANTLELRILMRQSQVPGRQAYINTELAKIAGNGYGFLTVDASVNPGYANNPGQQNPFWGFFVTQTGLRTTGGQSDFYRGNQYTISYLINTNDTFRLRRLYSPSGIDLVTGNSQVLDDSIFPVSDYVGNVLGAGFNGLGGSGASSVGEGLLQSVSQSTVLISASESYFLQAEAAYRAWPGFSDPASLFNAGVLASFVYLESDNPNINKNPSIEAADLTSQQNVNTNYNACTTPAQQLACIIRQKWVAMNGINPFESWCDYRRLNLPPDIPISISQYIDNPPTIPTRILYPISEYSTNTANVNAQGTINGHTSLIFWDQN